jgi:hypothetical protein
MKNETNAVLRVQSLTSVAYAATLTAVLLLPASALAQAVSGGASCFPKCRIGYVCFQNQCISACNPQCGANQTCSETGECIDKNMSLTAPPTAEAPPAGAEASVHVEAAPSKSSTTTQPDPKVAPVAPVAPLHEPIVSNSAPPSPAASADGVHMHDGYYFRAALGPSFVTSSSASVPGSSQDIDVSGTGVGLELAFGKTLQRGIVLGGGIFGQSVSSPKYSMSGISATGGNLSATGIGPFVDWYPDPAGGLHAEAAVGFASIKASKGDQFPAKDNSGSGFSVLAGVGYEWWFGDQVSVGVLARLQYAKADVKGDGDTQSSTVKLVTPALLASFTYQ